MHRLSFSRTEIVLLKSWTPVQQLVYHMLRVFVKTERLTERDNNSDAATLSNYHIKTLMLWACELKPRSWWMDDLNVVRLCVELLHTLGVWLTDARCPHYFIRNCNLFEHPDNCYCQTASRLMSETGTSLAEWFINSYIRKCAHHCPDCFPRLFDDVGNRLELHKTVSAVADCRFNISLAQNVGYFAAAQKAVALVVYNGFVTVRSYVCLIRDLVNIDQRLLVYLTANVFLHVAYKTTRDTLKDELLDILATTCLQSNDVRRCVNARHSSVLSLSQAVKLMKVVANNSHSTVQLIEVELSKAYLYRALKCKDSDSDSIYCLANVYLAVLYYTRGQYRTALYHCTVVTRSQGHSQCSSHVVQGELLPKIDNDIDNVLGLSVFYHYVRTAALNQQQQTQYVSVFTTELFAHYLHIRCLSFMKCRQPTQTSSTDEVQRYRKCFFESQEIFSTDVLVVNLLNHRKHATDNQRAAVAVSEPSVSETSHSFDTCELAELLKQSAVEHLTTFRRREAEEFGFADATVTTDFEALYAYKCGRYQRCLQLSIHNVRTLIGNRGMSCVSTYPEFIQLMDDVVVSLIGLALIVNPLCREDDVDSLDTLSQLPLLLHLLAQCQMRLHHPVASLAQTLNYVEFARRDLGENCTFDKLMLKLIERKILLYISRELV